MEAKPAISIIVPVYNARKYLSACIDSILAQTFVSFEILLIDDGSMMAREKFVMNTVDWIIVL